MCNPITTEWPHRLLLKGVYEGCEWEVTFNDMGHRCGYIRLPQGHPWHGKGYSEIPAEVHGGLTFAEPDFHCGKGGADDAWWIGFDCGHWEDAPDPDLPVTKPGFQKWIEIFHEMQAGLRATIKTTEYVKAECISLCKQAIEADRKGKS